MKTTRCYRTGSGIQVQDIDSFCLCCVKVIQNQGRSSHEKPVDFSRTEKLHIQLSTTDNCGELTESRSV